MIIIVSVKIILFTEWSALSAAGVGTQDANCEAPERAGERAPTDAGHHVKLLLLLLSDLHSF